MIRAFARQEHELHRIVDDAQAAVVGLETAHQRIRRGDMTGVGELYDSARDSFNRAADTFKPWLVGVPKDPRMMLYRAVVFRILASTRLLIDAVPFLPSPHDADAHRADEIIDTVKNQLVSDFALLRDLPAAIRSSGVFLTAADMDERLARDWEDKIAPLRVEIAEFTPKC